MGQIDAILKFTSAAAAKADSDVQQFYSSAKDLFFADEVAVIQAWRNSQDTTSSVTGPGGNLVSVTVHTFLTGFFVLISVPRIITSLANNAAIQIVVDRDMMNARTPGYLLKNNLSAPLLADIRFSPVFAGMDVPWGGLG